jgi:hypothetical protein
MFKLLILIAHLHNFCAPNSLTCLISPYAEQQFLFRHVMIKNLMLNIFLIMFKLLILAGNHLNICNLLFCIESKNELPALWSFVKWKLHNFYQSEFVAIILKRIGSDGLASNSFFASSSFLLSQFFYSSIFTLF